MSRRGSRESLLSSCFCGSENRRRISNEIPTRIGEQLAHLIQEGDLEKIQALLSRLKSPEKAVVFIRRRNFKTPNNWPLESKAFINFHQECNPVVWAVDCQQWGLLPILKQFGINPNRPLLCRRHTSFYFSNVSKYIIQPYKRFWTKGKYTYQSALDYFCASIYESLGEEYRGFVRTTLSGPLVRHFENLPWLLATSVIDVHRLDSVIIFNLLANSFNSYLSYYTSSEPLMSYNVQNLDDNIDEHASLLAPDIPQDTTSTENHYVELDVIKTLITNGFSRFEFLEYISPNHAWFGVLICLVCHPMLHLFSNCANFHVIPGPCSSNTHRCRPPMPSIILTAAELIINILALPSSYSSLSDFEENLDQIEMRKVYTKRYLENRSVFHDRLQVLRKQCLALRNRPLSLKLIVRNQIRHHLGGVGFKHRVELLPLCPELVSFLQYIRADDVCRLDLFPPSLVDLASGINFFTEPIVPLVSERESPICDVHEPPIGGNSGSLDFSEDELTFQSNDDDENLESEC